MFNGLRVIVCIPSGRYRYMRVLLPYLLASRNDMQIQSHNEVIDEIRLWVNTDVQSDIDYFERMEKTFPKVKCFTAQGKLSKIAYDERRNHYQYNDSVNRFYPSCVEQDAIYLKIDDDICFIHDAFLQNMLTAITAREQTNYACVANVFNVPHVTKILQEKGVLGDLLGKSTGDPRCPIACTNGEFAAYIHKQFLKTVEDAAAVSCFESTYYFDDMEIKGRQRIGVMGWTGKNFAQFSGYVGPRDEVELTTKIPERLQKPLWMVGNAVCCHFAFSHQRAVCEDQTNLLGRYLLLGIKLNGDIAA